MRLAISWQGTRKAQSDLTACARLASLSHRVMGNAPVTPGSALLLPTAPRLRAARCHSQRGTTHVRALPRPYHHHENCLVIRKKPLRWTAEHAATHAHARRPKTGAAWIASASPAASKQSQAHDQPVMLTGSSW